MNSQPNLKSLPHPSKILVSAQEFSALDPKKYLFQRKYDGRLSHFDFRFKNVGYTVLAEYVTSKSGGLYTRADLELLKKHGCFLAGLTLAAVDGQNLLQEPNGWRHEKLLHLINELKNAEFTIFPIVAAENNLRPATFCLQIFHDGAEGVVAHPIDEPWGRMLCHKRGEIFICRVLKTWGGKSVEIEETQDSVYQRRARNDQPTHLYQAIGSVPVPDTVADQLRVGSIIRVEGLCQTEDHKIREPKLCREWCIRL